MKNDGITGFWRGLPPTLVGIIPARSVYFFSYDATKVGGMERRTEDWSEATAKAIYRTLPAISIQLVAH